MFRIEPVNHHHMAVAEQVHAVLMLAYTQEAALLKVQHFASLDQSSEDVRVSNAYFLCALEGDEIIGALSLGPDNEANQLTISALVVNPNHQRRGVGLQLVREALRRGPGMTFSVLTGFNNRPALALYERLAFSIYRHGAIGPEKLPVVKLRMSAP